MNKTEIRQIILEETLSVLKELYTYDYIANKLVKTNLVKKGMSEKELIKQIFIQTKKEYGDKKAKFMINRDEDYLPDVLSAIKELLGEGKLNEAEQTTQTMEKDIEKIITKYFPKSYADVYFSKNLLPHITIVFAIGQKSDWSNGIFQNDPMATKILIRGDGMKADGSIDGKLEFEPLMSSLTLKAPEGSHLAYGRVKSGTRRAKGDYNAMMKAVEVSFAKMKKTVKDNINNLDDSHQWVKKYI